MGRTDTQSRIIPFDPTVTAKGYRGGIERACSHAREQGRTPVLFVRPDTSGALDDWVTTLGTRLLVDDPSQVPAHVDPLQVLSQYSIRGSAPIA